MEVLYLSTNLIDSIFIRGLFISILSILIVGKVLKADTQNAFKIIKGIIFAYTALNISYYLIAYYSPTAMDINFERATGPHSFAVYLTFLPNTLLPLLLLFKKLGRNEYVLLALSLLMNIGWMFELIAFYNTNLPKEYHYIQSPFNYLWFIVLKGLFVGSIIYAVGRSIKRKVPGINLT